MSKWITLDEARETTKSTWWKCEGPFGKQVSETQQGKGPANAPVWLDVNGDMYLGGWKKAKPHGYGILLRQDGRLLVGHRIDGLLKGPVKRVLLPNCSMWKDNQDPHSPIRDKKKGRGLPFLYIGQYKNELLRHDPNAVVILKDGTARIGPWKDNKPVGDWWKDHESSSVSKQTLKELLSFAGKSKSILKGSLNPLKSRKSPFPVPLRVTTSDDSTVPGAENNFLEPSSVNWPTATDDEDDEEDSRKSPQENTKTTETRALQDWLSTDVFTGENDADTMKDYARQLHKKGWTKRDITTDLVTREQIQSLRMSSAHQDQLWASIETSRQADSWLYRMDHLCGIATSPAATAVTA